MYVLNDGYPFITGTSLKASERALSRRYKHYSHPSKQEIPPLIILLLFRPAKIFYGDKPPPSQVNNILKRSMTALRNQLPPPTKFTDHWVLPSTCCYQLSQNGFSFMRKGKEGDTHRFLPMVAKLFFSFLKTYIYFLSTDKPPSLLRVYPYGE